jgi:hypothetical protein
MMAVIDDVVLDDREPDACWFVFGRLLVSVAIPAILIAYPMGKDCPECAERVKKEALKCRYCGHVFVNELTEVART